MRFAWLRRDGKIEQPRESSAANRVVFVAYNVVWWLPLALPLLGVGYTTALVAFLLVTVVRAVANLYRINVLPIDKAEMFPLRIP